MLTLGAAPTRGSATATADDTARFLAGLPLSSNSPLATFTNTPAWLSHARNLDSVFAREESFQLSKVREFSKKYLTDKHNIMLYMFSGPDFLYATSFFPNASSYVLTGLEPVGSVPNWVRLDQQGNLQVRPTATPPTLSRANSAALLQVSKSLSPTVAARNRRFTTTAPTSKTAHLTGAAFRRS